MSSANFQIRVKLGSVQAEPSHLFGNVTLKLYSIADPALVIMYLYILDNINFCFSSRAHTSLD